MMCAPTYHGDHIEKNVLNFIPLGLLPGFLQPKPDPF
jgi:hypothetical protein